MSKTRFEEFIEDQERRRVYEQESLAFDATEMICTLLKDGDVSRAELAKRIGKSKAYVTQVLGGTRNMTLHTFADFTFALGHKVSIKAVSLTNPHDAVTYRYDRVPMRHVLQMRMIKKNDPKWEEAEGHGAYSALPFPEDVLESAPAA